MVNWWVALWILITYFAWLLIHEMSHVIVAKRYGLKDYKLKLYPHLHKGSLRWASVEWTEPLYLADRHFAFVCIAPRIPDLIAVILFPLMQLLPTPYSYLLVIFSGAGVIDLAVGSIGKSSSSDLRQAAHGLYADPWSLRIAGFSMVLVSVSMYFAVYQSQS